MPIYEYRCEACGHELEAIQKISDEPLKECPACGQSGLRKLVSVAGFKLKGSGWYETDFKHSGKPAEKKTKPTTDKAAKSDANGSTKKSTKTSK